MIRFILVCIVVIAYLVLTIPVLLVEWIIGKFSPMTKDISSLRMVQAIFKFILWITGAKVTVIGEENVPKDQAVLYVANHRSYFDILLTYSRCPIRTGYVAKKEMEHYPLLSNWMRNLYCLFLDREDIKQSMQVIINVIKEVKEGRNYLIFAEGTRSKQGNHPQEFKGGSFKAAIKAKCPIVPVALIDSYKAFDTGSIKQLKVQVHFLTPISYEEYKDMKSTEIAAEVKSRIEKTIAENVN